MGGHQERTGPLFSYVSIEDRIPKAHPLQLDYNLLFRWFVGLNPEDPVWHPTSFTKNRDRMLNEELMARFLELLLAWASHSSLERIDGSDDDPPPPSGGNGFGSAPAKGKKRAKGDFRGLLLSNQTHRSSSDEEARLFRKSNSTGAYLSEVRLLVVHRYQPVKKMRLIPAEKAFAFARKLQGTPGCRLVAEKRRSKLSTGKAPALLAY